MRSICHTSKKLVLKAKSTFVESDALVALDNLLQDVSMPWVGVIAYDNTLWGGTVAMPESQVPHFMKKNREIIIKLNNFLVADSRIEIAHLPLGDGVTYCRRLH
ncbi:Caffeoyl-CoA O-methyltransferase [Bienertia sinuspersici]